MITPRDTALVARFSTYDTAVEIGIGRRPEVAVGLVEEGVTVTATDMAAVDVPDSVSFVRDDIVEASERDDPGECYHADLIYGLNLPPELHRPTRAVADAVDADFLFTTLGYDSPAVPCSTESIVGGETLYVARERYSRRM
ncbi:UPF0146 family protein [Halobellus captivus]|uniref:UPF0146 family protein n=1 Tax=Halobellus captivus TaxID=2592614 RepID=UPI0011AA0373|nr:UPF0146 family protein [Halobellus captivus]